ncbi:CHAT domain-containing protein [Streptomyces sp. NPDC002935]|uniref:CHAT domain-containing protein n=1 Tax=unclassified Streptomyces TaxID=2593676 RepID=UPI00331B4982
MTAQDAAAELVGLWPRLPGLVGRHWPDVRARLLETTGRLGRAGTDEERVEHAESLLELVLPYPQAREALSKAYFRGRRSGEPDGAADIDWAAVSRLLDAMPHEQWINARFEGRSPDEPLPAHRKHRLVVDVDRFAHPHAFASAQLALTVPGDADSAVLEVDVHGDPESVEVVPVCRSLVVWRGVPEPAGTDGPAEAAFDITLLRDDRPVNLVAVLRTADGHMRQTIVMTLHPSGRLEREAPLLPPWRTGTHSTSVALSLVIVRMHGVPHILAWDRGGAVSAELPHSPDRLDRMVRDVRAGIGGLLTGPHGRGYEESLDIPRDVYEADLRGVARTGLGFFNALFRGGRSGSPQLARIGEMIVTALADAGRDAEPPHIEIVPNGLNLPWHLLYVADRWREETLSPYRLLGLGAKLTLVPESCEHRHRTDEAERPASDTTALIAVNTDIDRPGTGAPRSLVSGQVGYWRGRIADRAEIIDDGDRVAEALRAPARPDSLWYFYCHLVPGGPGPGADPTLLFAGHKQVSLTDMRLDAPDDVPLPGAPLVVLNTCASTARGSALHEGFPSYFLDKGARAVIGTDIEVPTELGAAWAQRFFDRLLEGVPLGEALHRTARDLVEGHRNLLCLLYTALGSADVRLVLP